MALTSANVRVAVTGGVYRAPVGTALPTATSDALTGFTEQGYVSAEGIREQRSISSEDIKAWQNSDTVRRVVTDATVTYELTLIETSEATLETFYGTAATLGVGEGSIDVQPGATGGRSSWVIDVIDGAEKRRIVIEEGEVTDRGEVTYASGEAISYPITITAYPVNGSAATIITTALAS